MPLKKRPSPRRHLTPPNRQPPGGGRLSAQFMKLGHLCATSERVPLQMMMDSIGAESQVLVALFFALPFLLPIPLPGLSILFGVVIAVAGFAFAFGKKPVLPRRLLSKSLSGPVLRKIFGVAARFSKRIEKFVKPRWILLNSHRISRCIAGLMIAVCGLLLALPLPPGTNFPPAVAILLLSIGSLEEDFVFSLLGLLAFCLNLAFFSGLIMAGAKGLRFLF